MNWQKYFYEMANLVAKKSKDQSTQIGAVIVGADNEIRSTGYNSFPKGLNDDLGYSSTKTREVLLDRTRRTKCFI